PCARILWLRQGADLGDVIEALYQLNFLTFSLLGPSQLTADDCRSSLDGFVSRVTERPKRSPADDGVRELQRFSLPSTPPQLAPDDWRAACHARTPPRLVPGKPQHRAVARSIGGDKMRDGV